MQHQYYNIVTKKHYTPVELNRKQIRRIMEAAKRERAVAAQELAEAIRQADRYLESTGPTTRLVNQRIAKINEREERLRYCHYTYCEKAKIPLDDNEATTYLTEKTDAALDCTD